MKKKLKKEVENDVAIHKLQGGKKEVDKKYKILLKRIIELQNEKEAILQLKKRPKIHRIHSIHSVGTEATAFIVASDWHVEELVDPATINDVNEYNLSIAKERIGHFFANSIKLLDIAKRDIRIKTVVLSLLGDFVNNDIHEEFSETNQLLPIDASILAKDLIFSGIKLLLKKTDLNLVIVCHSGNHARTTLRQRISTEKGHSLEYFIYHVLAELFQGDKRVKFIIAEGQHTYLNVYDKIIRFSHGDGFRYMGGIGGIYIPAMKAIAQWNKVKKADLDVFAHWHQQRDAGNFICNGSVIGYNAYALKIKADFEEPKQCFFMMDSKGRKIIVTPIFLEDE